MSDETHLQPVNAGAALTPFDDGAASLLENVLAERDTRLAERSTLDLPIPTWDGKMIAVYGHLDEKDYNRLVSRLGPNPKPTLAQAQDILIASCQRVLLLEDKKTYELSTGYTRPLARRLAMADADEVDARAIVLHMCGKRALELATHAAEVLEFLQGASQEVEDELAGESESS